MSEPIENGCEDSQRGADYSGTARVVVVADRQRDMIKRGKRITVFGFKSGQIGSQVGLVETVTTVLGDRQAPAQGIQVREGDRRRGR